MDKIQIAVTTQDDKPLPAEANRDLFLTLTSNFPYQSENFTEPTVKKDKVKLDADGTFKLKLVPEAKTQSFQVQVI